MAETELLFLDYFKKLSGQGMYFDQKKRVVRIVDYKEDIIEVYLAKRVPPEFKMYDALHKSVKEGDVSYYVFEDGVEGKNWLYPLTLATIL